MAFSPHTWLRKFTAPRRVFLDYASSTPVDKAVARVVRETEIRFHNPSALYREGVDAKHLLEDARTRVAACIGCKAQEVVFTSSGTEANNLALLGVVRAAARTGNPVGVVSSVIEHPATEETLAAIEADASVRATVTRVGVDENGFVDGAAIANALTPETVLVTLIYVHNEFGVVQRIRDVRRTLDEYKRSIGRKLDEAPYLHIDACQAPAWVTIDKHALGADLITLDGSKCYGPKGAGALFVRHGVLIEAIQHGGGQERGLRSGTPDVARTQGLALALETCTQRRKDDVARISSLRDEFIDGITSVCAIKNRRVIVNGFYEKGENDRRAANNVNVCIEGLDAEFAVIMLDAHGICASAGASCATSDDVLASQSVAALDSVRGTVCATSSLRLTLGRETSRADIRAAILAIGNIL